MVDYEPIVPQRIYPQEQPQSLAGLVVFSGGLNQLICPTSRQAQEGVYLVPADRQDRSTLFAGRKIPGMASAVDRALARAFSAQGFPTRLEH